MNTKFEMNSALTDETLDGVAGGWMFSNIKAAIVNTHPAVTKSSIPETNRGLGSQEAGRLL